MLVAFAVVAFTSSFLLAAVAVLITSLVWERKRRGSESSLAVMQFGGAPAILKTDELSSIAPWRNFLDRFDFVDRMRVRMAESDLAWSVGRLTALMLLIGAFSAVTLSGLDWLPLGVALLLACGAAWLPYGYVLRRRTRRFDTFEKQFPDALDFLARCLRAGHPLSVSLELLAQEETAPLSTEMRKTAEERKFGMPLDQALENLARRVPMLNVRVFVAAVKLQSRTGGRLSEVLNSLAESMREAAAMEGEVKALAAHGRVTGSVLTVMPLGIAFLMTAVNPGYLNILIENPTGRNLVIVCAVALVAAHFVIRKIVDIRL